MSISKHIYTHVGSYFYEEAERETGDRREGSEGRGRNWCL